MDENADVIEELLETLTIDDVDDLVHNELLPENAISVEEIQHFLSLGSTSPTSEIEEEAESTSTGCVFSFSY
jgi:hypothetical protein